MFSLMLPEQENKKITLYICFSFYYIPQIITYFYTSRKISLKLLFLVYYFCKKCRYKKAFANIFEIITGLYEFFYKNKNQLVCV